MLIPSAVLPVVVEEADAASFVVVLLDPAGGLDVLRAGCVDVSVAV